MTFESLNLIKPILDAVKSEGYEVPTPIQTMAIPPLLEGKDLLGSAQTGTGKTAAFAIPILQRLNSTTAPVRKDKKIKALVLTPTRELAAQIQESFKTYGKNLSLKTVVIFGGVGQKPQTDMIHAGLDILIATPGRLLDLIGQGFIDLSHLEYFVLDEADRMLDMGFINDVKKVIKELPKKRQTMLFSATMPKDIEELAQSILTHPIRIAVTPVETTVEAIDQSVYHVGKRNKNALLRDILKRPEVTSALVFSRTKHGANKISQALIEGGIYAEAIHGNKSQSARTEALRKFKEKKMKVLVATDIAARGLDIDHLSHVINYDLPEVPETYIHRIGRTGRAGLDGIAISFCGEEEYGLLIDIEYHIGQKIKVELNHPYNIKPSLQKPQPKPQNQQRRR
jgi:ATP-dependent RNA helicase RhlE